MTKESCSWEERVLECATGESPAGDDIRAHVASCPGCRETAAVSEAVGKIRKAALGDYAAREKMTAAELVALARRRRIAPAPDAAAILKPLRVYRRLAVPVGLAAGLGLIFWNAASLIRLVRSFPGFQTLAIGLRAASEGPGAVPLVAVVLAEGSGLLALLVVAAATRISRTER